ncbi:MAG: hypothetical protein IRZ13_21245 [Acetobacteraceae bacterium]|nr:hypothetical protein [Acetobacteraceae bacterium]
MHTSRPIEVRGRFLGVAVTHAAAWRFIALDPVVADMDGATFQSPAEAVRAASRLAVEDRHGQRLSQPTATGPERP